MLEIILVDWTRMGGTYCLAGAVPQQGYRIVRPLQVKNRSLPQRKFGWWFRPFEGHSRWEVFELVKPQAADPQPPHLEDLWVASLRPRGRVATVEERRAILEATLVTPGESLFGQPLQATRASAFLQPGAGQRSLATLKVRASSIVFAGSCRDGAVEPDFRVQLAVPDLGTRTLPVKDHHLLLRAKAAGPDVNQQVAALQAAVAGMGDTVAVRVGLSRPFRGSETSGAAAACWLMADGFFSWADPQS
ncbi:MAG: hypothetical protein L0Y71_09740 [Gemmataceae bacterium]|nr:hypothetical protein [Gemmataceae bacterium]